MTAASANMQKTLLAAVKGAAKTKARSDRMFASLICRAVEAGIPQTAVAYAAGTSQAHVSRTVAANRKLNEERKAARRSKRNNEGGQV
jgi:hypothetical protein